MIETALIGFGTAILIGAFMAVYGLQHHHIPKALAVLHGLAVLTGIIFLVLFIAKQGLATWWWIAGVFLLTAAGGLYLLLKDLRKQQFPLWLLVLHALAGLAGFIILLIAYLRDRYDEGFPS